MFWYLLCHPLPRDFCLSSRTYRHRGLKSSESCSFFLGSWGWWRMAWAFMAFMGVFPKCGDVHELLRYSYNMVPILIFLWGKLTPKRYKSSAQYHRTIWGQCQITRAIIKGLWLSFMVTAVFYTSIANQAENVSSIKNHISGFGPYLHLQTESVSDDPSTCMSPRVLIYRPGTGPIIHLPHRTKLR